MPSECLFRNSGIAIVWQIRWMDFFFFFWSFSLSSKEAVLTGKCKRYKDRRQSRNPISFSNTTRSKKVSIHDAPTRSADNDGLGPSRGSYESCWHEQGNDFSLAKFTSYSNADTDTLQFLTYGPPSQAGPATCFPCRATLVRSSLTEPAGWFPWSSGVVKWSHLPSLLIDDLFRDIKASTGAAMVRVQEA